MSEQDVRWPWSLLDHITIAYDEEDTGMWSNEREIIEGLISMARSRVTHEGDFLQQWRNYAYGANLEPLTEEQALAALDWLEGRLDMPVNPDA